MDVLEAIRTRRSARKWLQKPVPEDLVEQILEAGRWAPSAGNFQPWAFIVIQEDETKERVQKVAEESKNLSRIWAPYFREGESRGYIVDLRNVPLGIAIFADPRHAPPHTGGEIGHIIGASLAAMNMWLAVHALGLGACFWSHMMLDKIKAILGIPHHWDFIGLLGIGYVDGDGSPDGYNTSDSKYWERKPLDQVAFYEWYKVKQGERPRDDKIALLHEFLGL
ncbi:MAG TPA: nitroreductase family protein [Roseiflexaceae bacterium]|jgi:nicotinate-nucleotide--dimethylbenzimidazole phosphoribosyltransferase